MDRCVKKDGAERDLSIGWSDIPRVSFERKTCIMFVGQGEKFEVIGCWRGKETLEVGAVRNKQAKKEGKVDVG